MHILAGIVLFIIGLIVIFSILRFMEPPPVEYTAHDQAEMLRKLNTYAKPGRVIRVTEAEFAALQDLYMLPEDPLNRYILLAKEENHDSNHANS